MLYTPYIAIQYIHFLIFLLVSWRFWASCGVFSGHFKRWNPNISQCCDGQTSFPSSWGWHLHMNSTQHPTFKEISTNKFHFHRLFFLSFPLSWGAKLLFFLLFSHLFIIKERSIHDSTTLNPHPNFLFSRDLFLSGNLSAWIFPTCTVAISKDRFRSVRGAPKRGNREGRMVGCKRFLGFPKAYVLTRFFFEIQCLQLNMWGFFLKFMSCMKIPWDGCQLLGSYWPTENHKSVPSLNSLCGKCQVQMHVSAHYRPFAGVGALVLMMYMLIYWLCPPPSHNDQ